MTLKKMKGKLTQQWVAPPADISGALLESLSALLNDNDLVDAAWLVGQLLTDTEGRELRTLAIAFVVEESSVLSGSPEALALMERIKEAASRAGADIETFAFVGPLTVRELDACGIQIQNRGQAS